MLSLAHTLISLPFGVYLNSPIAIFASAFIFHLLADTLLHWNVYPEQTGRMFYPLAALDVIGGVVVAWLILQGTFFTAPILLAVLAGNLPDILQGLWDLLPKHSQRTLRFLKPAFTFHDKLQLETTRIGKGLIWQAVLVVLAVLLVA